MKAIYRSSAVLALFLTVSACSDLPLSLNSIKVSPKQFDERQIIVTLSEDIQGQWQSINKEILDRFDVQPAGVFPLKSIRVNCLVYRVSEMVDVGEILHRLRADKRIELVQANQVFEGVQGTKGNGYSELSYGPKMIHVNLVHNIATGKGVSIAVIDTGADTEHADLKGHITESHNFVDGGDGSFLKDMHGTAVSGVIGASNYNGMGIDGIAPNANISVYKACWYANLDNGRALCSSWTLAKAIDAAIAKGNRIINLSLAGPEDPLLSKLLQAADKKHIVLVAAALENKSVPGFPASLPFVLPVISADPTGKTTLPSWRLNQNVIAAPGIEVLTTTPDDHYDFISGSSLAAAHVTGVIALLLEHKPDILPEAVRSILSSLAKKRLLNDGTQPITMIDACHALKALGATPNCP